MRTTRRSLPCGRAVGDCQQRAVDLRLQQRVGGNLRANVGCHRPSSRNVGRQRGRRFDRDHSRGAPGPCYILLQFVTRAAYARGTRPVYSRSKTQRSGEANASGADGLHDRQSARRPLGFTAASLDERLAQAAVRRLAAKEHVFCEGDARDYVFRIEDGVIAVYKTLPDGRRQIIDFAYPGDLIGLGVLDEHVLSAQATTAAKVRCLSASALERMAESDAELGA